MGAQEEGEGVCRAHMSCEADRCQGLEQMRLPWLLQPGSTWPPAASPSVHRTRGSCSCSWITEPPLWFWGAHKPLPLRVQRVPRPQIPPMNADDPGGNKEAAKGTFHPGFVGKVAPRSFPPLPMCPLQSPAALAATSCTARTPGPGQPHGAALAEIPWRITHHSGFGSLPKGSSPAHVAAKGVLPGNAGGTLT